MERNDAPERTMVLVSLPVESNPVEPHRPGTFVVGYLAGDLKTAHGYLNSCKRERDNALVENSWLLPVGISFTPNSADDAPDPRDPRRDPRDPRQMRPQRGPIRLDVQHAAVVIPFTRMDNSNGVTWAVPITEKTVWVFPTGTMLQDLEAKIDHARNTLVEARAGLGVASANSNIQNLRG